MYSDFLPLNIQCLPDVQKDKNQVNVLETKRTT